MMVHTTIFTNLIMEDLAHVKSNDASQFIKKISSLVKERLSRQSPRKENIFVNSKDYYKQRQRQCGCNKILHYTEEKNEINSKPRKRKTLFFTHLTANQSKLILINFFCG